MENLIAHMKDSLKSIIQDSELQEILASQNPAQQLFDAALQHQINAQNLPTLTPSMADTLLKQSLNAKQYDAAISHLQSKFDDYKQFNDQTFSDFKRKLHEKNDEISKLQQQIFDNNNNLQEIQKQLQEKDNQIDAKQKEIDSIKLKESGEVQNSTKQIESLQGQLNSINSVYSEQLKKQETDFQQQISQLQEQVKNSSSNAASSDLERDMKQQQQIHQLQDELNVQKQKINESDNIILQQQLNLDKLEKTNKQQFGEIDSLRLQLSDAKKNKNELLSVKQQLDEAQQMNKQLSQESQQLQQYQTKIMQENRRLSSESNQLETKQTSQVMQNKELFGNLQEVIHLFTKITDIALAANYKSMKDTYQAFQSYYLPFTELIGCMQMANFKDSSELLKSIQSSISQCQYAKIMAASQLEALGKTKRVECEQGDEIQVEIDMLKSGVGVSQVQQQDDQEKLQSSVQQQEEQKEQQ